MTQLRSDISFSMPCAMIQHLPFEKQIETVKKAGFQELTLHPYFMADYNRKGISLADMKAMADDAGLKISRIDPLTTWVPDWLAWNLGNEYNIKHSMDSSLFFELSNFFGCRYVSLNAMWKAGHYTYNQTADFYSIICERAAPYGLICDIEPVPMWGVTRLEDALQIINEANVLNGGLVFDVTHFSRGGTPLEVLEGVPGDPMPLN